MSDELQRLCGQACPPLDDVLLALDRELQADGVDGAARALARLAARLPDPGGDPIHELACVAGVLRDGLRSDGTGSLALSEVLRDGGGHPLATAAAAVCAARRRGLAIDLVGHGARVWIAHEETRSPYVVDAADPRAAFDARALGVDLHWRCAHEVALVVLDVVVDRAERCGDLAWALHAAGLRARLPMQESDADSRRTEVQRLRARLN
ncbi:MAG: hypothetical protein ACEQSX_17145 [Baekduiaceae bacterium]